MLGFVCLSLCLCLCALVCVWVYGSCGAERWVWSSCSEWWPHCQFLCLLHPSSTQLQPALIFTNTNKNKNTKSVTLQLETNCNTSKHHHSPAHLPDQKWTKCSLIPDVSCLAPPGSIFYTKARHSVQVPPNSLRKLSVVKIDLGPLC